MAPVRVHFHTLNQPNYKTLNYSWGIVEQAAKLMPRFYGRNYRKEDRFFRTTFFSKGSSYKLLLNTSVCKRRRTAVKLLALSSSHSDSDVLFYAMNTEQVIGEWR